MGPRTRHSTACCATQVVGLEAALRAAFLHTDQQLADTTTAHEVRGAREGALWGR